MCTAIRHFLSNYYLKPALPSLGNSYCKTCGSIFKTKNTYCGLGSQDYCNGNPEQNIRLGEILHVYCESCPQLLNAISSLNPYTEKIC